jgi:hypothetical protein
MSIHGVNQKLWSIGESNSSYRIANAASYPYDVPFGSVSKRPKISLFKESDYPVCSETPVTATEETPLM